MSKSTIIPKRGTDNSFIGSDYFKEEPHADNIMIDLVVQVYSIGYDWGRYPIFNHPATGYDGSVVSSIEGNAPLYLGTLDGYVTSANFTIDSTTDMRSTCSLSLILDYDSKFIDNAGDDSFWGRTWLRIEKKYIYLNDVGMYPEYDWNGKKGLWNNNGIIASDPSDSVIGWFVPNENSSSFNAETREFSISCTDMMSLFTESRGGHLTSWNDSGAGVQYRFYETEKAYQKAGMRSDGNREFEADKKYAAIEANGFILEGERSLQMADKQYGNYLTQLQDNGEEASVLWKDSADIYNQNHELNENDRRFYIAQRTSSQLTTVTGLLTRIAGDYGHLMPWTSISINLQNDTSRIPYDIDISGDTSLYTVFKKITDLYPRQYVYFDTDRRLNFCQGALRWRDMGSYINYRAREFSGLVVEEHWNTSYENISNFVVVFGRDQACSGYYWITDMRGICEQCGTVYDYFSMPSNPERRFCPKCGADSKLKRLYISDRNFTTDFIGTHKKVVYDDNLVTEQECFDAAKAIALESCRAARTLTVTLEDRYISMYHLANKGVGERIEYKSKTTGETDIYNVLKWSNDFSSGTVTLELEPFYTCADEAYMFRTKHGECLALPSPVFTYDVDENGMLTMVINNGWFTKYSLFKIYFAEMLENEGEGDYLWFSSFPLDFMGETCEVYSEETETQYQTKVYHYQFTKNGRYGITCQAWNPNIHPSGCDYFKIITVDSFKVRLTACGGKYLATSSGKHILYS